METFVGVDVGAKSVVVAWRHSERTAGTAEYVQTPEGHQALIKHMQKFQVARVVLEATGVYYLDLAVALSRSGLPVAVINPRSFHHFAKRKLHSNKTDMVDAALLAEYGECMKPALWQARRRTDGLARRWQADQQADCSTHPGESVACLAFKICDFASAD